MNNIHGFSKLSSFKAITIILFIFFILSACSAESEVIIGEVISENCKEARNSGIEICNDNQVCGEDAVCHPCGKIGELCCGDNICNDDGVCGIDGICNECGNKDERCCLNEECNSQNICTIDGFCRSCGSEQELCCEGNKCQELHICDSDGLCKPCGHDGLPVCEGELCTDWHINENGVCIRCGGENQLICPLVGCGGWYIPVLCNECSSWLEQFNGLCANPFKAFGNIEGTWCENFEGNQDMCYWNAAYFRKDLSYCENIELKEAKEKCLNGANPENYAIYNIPFWVP